MRKLAQITLFFALSLCLVACSCLSYGSQADNLHMLLKSRSSQNSPISDSWPLPQATQEYSPVYIGSHDGLMQADKIDSLPGQPNGVDFDQYSGYVTVDPQAGRALFYYFVESPQNSSTAPLVLWLNGGPGCSSLIGAWAELGPFRVNSDGKTLFRNNYGWNNASNVIFLESPAGVGFSYSNTSSDYHHTGDKSTANDAYTFLVNWLERFPQYKTRDFYITGESYAGHYVPQLAYTILLNNKVTNQTVINLKGIAKGLLDYWWTHALLSDETHEKLITECQFVNDTSSPKCEDIIDNSFDTLGDLDVYNIYAPICLDPVLKNGSTGSVDNIDPCSGLYVITYLNTAEVQTAFHAKLTEWGGCTTYNWTDAPTTILPVIQNLIASDIRVWVGGYVEEYKGITLVTVRGAGHMVPSYQPERALAMFKSFLQGTLPPPK
ncbi:hypothetical protein RJ639_015681 [Escallonia herrerae]|uniref:Carboxypeptidase n=1 Tax=Escallonia herrerae TaxID=1293975 RepID=A0AA88VFI6_9ASTE|nr:hypothetical protein RJ639_015681 [Escallonia herrerae]